MANSLAELEVLGLERFLDLGLPGPRRVLLRLLLRGRRRAGGQAVQHLPDVEFPHGLDGAPPRPGRGGKGRPRAGARARAEGSADPGHARRSGRAREPERKGAAGEKHGTIPTGNAAPTTAATPLAPRPPRLTAAAVAPLRPPPSRSAAREPSGGGGARARSAQPHLAAGCRCAAPPPRLAPAASMARRPPAARSPRALAPAPAPPPRGVAGPRSAAARPRRRSAPLPARHRAGGSPRPPPRPASPGPPRLAAPEPAAPRRSARPQRPPGQPRLQRRPRRWRQLGLRGAGLPSLRMRAALPAPPPPAPSRERSWGLNYPLRKSQIGAKFLPPHSPRQRLQLLLLQPGGENVAG